MATSESDRHVRMIDLLQEAIKALMASVESGLGFDHAMYQYGQGADNELSHAFAEAIEEMGTGTQRKDALRNMAGRIDVPEVTAFIEAVIRADEEGKGILETLTDQAERTGRSAGT